MIASSFRIFVLLILAVSAINAQTTSFNYQGSLTDGGTPANGSFQMQFKLFDAVSGGSQQGSTLTNVAVTAADGMFSVKLDFGSAVFGGGNRWIEVSVRRNSGESYVLLTPREQITSSPYSLRTLSAAVADNAQQLGGVNANQFVQTNDSRLTDARSPLPNSPSYIQNQNAGPQAASNFNISGTGSAGIFNATQQYNLGGNRFLTASSPFGNTFLGLSAGFSGSGVNNTYVGTSAGGAGTVKANSNTFVGLAAGSTNLDGFENSYFGTRAGQNAQGRENSFFGSDAGRELVIGVLNTFLGHRSGSTVTSGDGNTLIGAGTTVSNNVLNGTAIGFGAVVAASNRMVLGQPQINTVIGGNGSSSPAKLNIFTITAAPWTTASWSSAIKLEDAAAIGWDSAGTRFGIGKSGGGLYFFHTNSFIGSTNAPAIYDMIITDTGNIGINTISPQRLLHVNGRARVASIPVEANVGQVCFNAAGDLLGCGASSMKWKSNVRPFNSGLDTLMRLRPINFNWTETGLPDIGLGAEDVAKVAPELTLRDSDGKVAGVKYERLNMILINAVKELKAQVEKQRLEIDRLRSGLKRHQKTSQRKVIKRSR